MTEQMKKMIQIRELLMYINDPLVDRFFDVDSTKMLDQKIAVLTDLKNGKKPSEIPDYYTVLELYPKEGMWD